ncbi:hypothetical protein CMALT394_620009 [Carnobacterium maltaromaticum]|nr:hypothetical protein CMALT394_620009 [Carnobacterium maltaromaticum]
MPSSAATIQGIEVVNTLYKKSRRKMSSSTFLYGMKLGIC